MDTESLVPDRFRATSRTIGNGEIVWRGTDIREVLLALCDQNAIILGLESVVFPSPSSGPMVGAISDASHDIQIWQLTKPRLEVIRLAFERAIQDIERTVPNPYRDDVWYCVVAETGTVGPALYVPLRNPPEPESP